MPNRQIRRARTSLGLRSSVSGDPAPLLVIENKLIDQLRPHPANSRLHSQKQIRQIAASEAEFGFIVPIIANSSGEIICGHGRWLAARVLGLAEVPVVQVRHLSPAQIRAFQIADNKLCENAAWDERVLGQTLRELSLMNLDFDLEITGFEVAKIEMLINGLDDGSVADDPDELPPPAGPAVCRPGDLWELLGHKVLCGDALSEVSYKALMAGEQAAGVFTDPPYNVSARHIGGRGKIKHADFIMAAGEMTEAEFTAFLIKAFTGIAAACSPGALIYVCMDWRHVFEAIVAGRQAFEALKSLCIWAKPHPGQGSFYRSQHELVLVFKAPGGAARNNIRQGRYGRNRSTLWTYPSPASFGRLGEEGRLLEAHPTPKPVAMIADALLDCTVRGDIVLDPFLGGGASLVAAERTGRHCRAIEIDPKYVDVSLRRLMRHTGEDARRVSDGRCFSDIEAEAADGGG